jgi:hypothetical protein
MTAFDISRAADAVVPGDSVAFSERDKLGQRLDYWLDIALEDSFPCSDPISSMQTD